MNNHKILNISPAEPPLQEALSKALGISTVTAQVLINRGIKDASAAEAFMHVSLENLLDPYSFSGMHAAVGIIRNAALKKQRVMIFGDYDVDGMTALALLKSAFARLGIEALHYIPHRVKEGYGLSKDILRIAQHKKIDLVVTADCGTNSFAEIRQLRDNGIEVVVTDHHEQSDTAASPASALINPKSAGSGYAYREL
ncbi:MAG: DHH family phosphoesterase, partial [Candidatus Omnitrophica bacterium]|nr:DHH family phosphoesterase [Candidatus Omnitrophota bacterium]